MAQGRRRKGRNESRKERKEEHSRFMHLSWNIRDVGRLDPGESRQAFVNPFHL
jgi:hypothetical protein